MKQIIFLALYLVTFRAQAQLIKTDVLVIGNNAVAFAAGWQAASSGLKAHVLNPDAGFEVEALQQQELSGMAPALMHQYKLSLGSADTSQTFHHLDFKAINALMTLSADSNKNLNIVLNAGIDRIQRRGSGWLLQLGKGKQIRAKMLILTQEQPMLWQALKMQAPAAPLTEVFNNNSPYYKTSVAAILPDKILPIKNVFIPQFENLLYITDKQAAIGQMAGAVAGYAAFFNKKLSEVNVRMVQAELMKFGQRLLPIADIDSLDTQWPSMQSMALSGVLQTRIDQGKLYFNPQASLSLKEIEAPLKLYYYKAQIWFEDHAGENLSLENLIKMMAYIGNKTVPEITKDMEKKWNNGFQFEGKMDLQQEVNRRTFSILMQQYLSPFQVTLDRNGKILK